MKRDMDLVRQVLLAIEQDEGEPNRMIHLAFPDSSATVVSYHVMLLKEAGLVDAIDCTSSDGYEFIPQRLTWAGHEFLDTARNETIWKEAKTTVISKLGSASFEILKSVLTQAASRALGIAP